MSTLPLPWEQKVGAEFAAKVRRIADRLEADPCHLLAVMHFETGGTFSPDVRNGAGSGAVGLIQFMPRTAVALGTSTEALAQMSALDQLDLVEAYLKPYRGRLLTLSDCYMAVLWPAAIGRAEDHVLFRRGTRAYDQNRGLDVNGDGLVTKAEAAAKVRERLQRELERMRAETMGRDE